ncbi:cupin [Halobacteriales archaeon QS_5_70_17]|nr:MAG: cupin [Halobacteriales archaeon QS_5_70_17]
MERVAIEDVESVPHFMGANTVRKPLSRAVDGMGFAMTYFELSPGESFSGGLHTHRDQEELFYVLEGVATFEIRETADGETEVIDVRAGEVVHFGAGDVYQTGGNATDEPVVAVSVGVPGARHDWDGVEAVVDCPECGRATVHSVVPSGDERMPGADVAVVCDDCGEER